MVIQKSGFHSHLHYSYSGGCPYDEFGDSSVIHMLTGWTPQTISLKSCQPSDVWKILTGLLPLWVRREVDEEEETESSTKGELEEENKKKEKEKTDSLPLQEEKESRQDYIVIGSFSSCFPGITMKPFTMAFTDEVVIINIFLSLELFFLFLSHTVKSRSSPENIPHNSFRL